MTSAAEIGSAANSYEILAKLAAGGMAEIFLARGASVGGVERYVVLKRILRHRAADAQLVRMFLDEARLAAQLQHANIAQVYDIGKLGDAYFFTMEYVHGETLRTLLARAHGLRREIPVACVLTIAAQTAAGLDYAHARLGRDGRPLGIVHRDVSPSNLMVSFDGGVKIVDFGVAKAADRMQETRSGTVKGKISYLSPEQCRGTAVDRRADLFSFGICMWEMLATDRLYRRGSDFENMTAIVTEPPLPPSSRRPDLPPELDAIVLRLLDKDPDRRFQTAGDVVEAIEEVAMRSGSVLSTAGLGRFMRELFGQRPEPWIELDTFEAHEGPVTVTGEPVIGDLGSGDSALDVRLAAVRDLSAQRDAVERSGAYQPPVSMPLAAPVGGERPTITVVAGSLAELQARMPGPPQSPPSPMASPEAPTMISPPRVGDQIATSIYDKPIPTSVYTKPPRPRRTLVYVIGSALALGLALGISVAMCNRPTLGVKPRTDIATPAAEPADAAVARVEAADAAVVAMAPADAAIAHPPEVIVEPADAAVAVAPADAEVVHAAPPDAAPPRRSPPPPTVQQLVTQGRYGDAIEACHAGPAPAGDRAVACVLAACHQHNLGDAKRWLRPLPAGQHVRLVAACRATGTDVEPAPAPPPPPPPHVAPDAGVDCAANPLACQHP